MGFSHITELVRACSIALVLLGSPSQASLNYPTPLLSRLERLLVDTDGAFRTGFKDAITPCSNYVNGAQTLDRQTSAQWVRVAYHDFVTAQVVSGTGGIDASIGFETAREENKGVAFNDSFSFFAPFSDAQTSTSDLLALAVVTSLGNCGGLQVPLRGGRIDAAGPGPPGVPEEQTGLEETLADFARAGFNRSEAIGLTACGHSLGRVHYTNFPDVVSASAVTQNNTGGGQAFDSTPTNFDIDVVREYLSSTGQCGGPLVTTFNMTTRTDRRLYESDGNATIRTLGQSTPFFFATCKELYEKMLNTVPKEVQLSPVVQPMTVKPVNVTFDIDRDGGLKISGYIRLLSAPLKPAPSEILVTAQSAISVSALPDQGYNIWGNTSWYRFSSTLSPSRPIPKDLVVTVEDEYSHFPLQAEVFFVPELSGSGMDANTTRLTITAAVWSRAGRATDVSAVVAYPTAQLETLAPRIETLTVHLVVGNTFIAGFGGADYVLYSGSVALDADVVPMTSVDIKATFANGTTVMDEYNHFV